MEVENHLLIVGAPHRHGGPKSMLFRFHFEGQSRTKGGPGEVCFLTAHSWCRAHFRTWWSLFMAHTGIRVLVV